MSEGLVLVGGAGPGLGQALCDRFARGGYTVVGLTRSGQGGLAVDLTDAKAATQKIDEMIGLHGAPKVVIHNTAHLVISDFLNMDLEEFEACWAANVKSAMVLAKATFSHMIAAGGGAFLVSGATASLRGGARFGAFASAKFALRGLTQALAREHQSMGIHVAHVILDGIIDTPKSRDLHDLDPSRMMATEDIAESYWHLAHQPKSTWTHELDLRPATERF